MEDNLPQISFSKEKQKRHLPGLDIITLEDLFSRHGDFASKPHRVNFYHILYISQGSGNHYVDFRPFPLAAGDLLFISPGQVYAFAMDQQNTRGFLILFTEEFFTDNLAKSTISIRSIVSDILDTFAMATEPVRPGRKFPRNHKRAQRKYCLNYKPIL